MSENSNNSNNFQNPTIDEALEQIGTILAEGLEDSQKLFIFIKIVEMLNNEIKISQSTRKAIIEKTNAVTYGNKSSHEQALILKYCETLQKAQKFSSKIILKHISEIKEFSPSDLKTFKLHYIDGVPFNQMYECVPENDSEYSDDLKDIQKKKYEYASYADRSNMSKKLLTLLRGFKSRKPESDKDIAGAEK